MNEPIKFRPPSTDGTVEKDEHREEATEQTGAPSNPVHARVGDLVLHAARDGIRRGLTPEDVIREITARYHVHLRLGEFRLLLASRDRRARGTEKLAPETGIAPHIVSGKD